MLPPRALLHTLVPMLALVLLLSSCIMPSRQDATPALSLAEPPMAAPVPEPTAEDRAAVVNRNANVRPGPDTNHALPEGTASEPQTAEPTERKSETASEAEVLTVTVTGSVVNLRAGPSLHHAVLGQVRQGEALAATGISEDREWLQVALEGESLWIFADLTDVARRRRVLPVTNANACPARGPSPSLACDKQILLSIRESIDLLHTLDSWHSDAPLSDFKGVTVGGEPPRVIELKLYGVVFRNHLPQASLPRLSHLQVLVLRDPGIVEPLAPELGNLTRLQHLDLSRGSDIPVLVLEGPIPPELGQLSQLQYLDLSGNEIEGPIPPELGQLSQLQYLDLSGNYHGPSRYPPQPGLTGPIPPELGQLSQLQYLDLSGNYLKGPIPPQLGQLIQLQTLYLHNNRLTDPLPSQLGHLVQLNELNLYYNQLSGLIPPELGHLVQLNELNLYGNDLSGPIPPELGHLVQLNELNLYGNQLNGPIPPELGRLVQLNELDLRDNQLSGPIPPELGQLVQLDELWLYDNDLSGPIPPELGRLVRLNELNLRDNQLSGSIPRSWAGSSG